MSNSIHTTHTLGIPELRLQHRPRPDNPLTISSTREAVALLRRLWDPELINLQEQFAALFLDTKGTVLGYRLLNTGTGISTQVDVPMLIRLASLTGAYRVILAHNHTNGNPCPSAADVVLTHKLRHLLGLMNMDLADHIILTCRHHISMADTGVISTRKS